MKTTANRTSTASFTQRISNQERRITNGVKAGTITANESTALRSKLHSLQNDGFDGGKALNKMHGDIKKARGNDEVDVEKRASNIDRRIEKGLADGSLTQAEADALKTKAEAAKTALASATTPEAKQAAAATLKSLSKEVRSARHNDQFDAQKRMESFKQRIDKGVANGRLTADEASKLNEKLSGLNQNATADQINSMSKDIFQQKHNARVDAPATTQALTTRLDSLEGKLSAEQLSKFREQLQTLSGDATASGPSLNLLREQINAALN